MSLWCSRTIIAQQRSAFDDTGEAVIRLTDLGADASLGEVPGTIPDILGYELGAWQPVAPQAGLYAGDWADDGRFLRFDLWIAGLVNPPGPLGLARPSYDPFLYGGSPIVGFVEFNMDADAETGGELDFPEFRYLANLGRFGGLLDHPLWRDRAAACGTDIDHTLSTAPFIDRSGEEFHIAIMGDNVSSNSHRVGAGGAQRSLLLRTASRH